MKYYHLMFPGLGLCGTCAVEVNGPVTPSHWNIHEIIRLNLPPFRNPTNRKFRLACQCRVGGELEVSKHAGLWGHREELSNESSTEFKAPLKKWEFIFDKRTYGFK